MAKLVPESTRMFERAWPTARLREVLNSLLEFTGAKAAWIGLQDAMGRLVFPVAIGDVPADWLTKQQGIESAWGFVIREAAPTLVNDLPDLPGLGGPSLKNILSCPIPSDEKTVGQIVLANKIAGFQAADASVLQAMAHLVSRYLFQGTGDSESAVFVRFCNALENLDDGVLALEAGGEILFANSTFAKWSGFEREELLGNLPPYPFWINHRVLYNLAPKLETPSEEAAPKPVLLPFRSKGDKIFWCRLQSAREEIGGRQILLVFLRMVDGDKSALQPVASQDEEPQLAPATETSASSSAFPNLVLGVQPGREIKYWDRRWEEITGLSGSDLADVPSELVLDWIFPNQADRERVAEVLNQQPPHGRILDLQVLTAAGSTTLQSHWLPVETPEEKSWIVLFDLVKPAPNKPELTPVSQIDLPFLKGLSHFLNYHLVKLIGLADQGKEQSDASSKALGQFDRILDATQPLAKLLDQLQNLATIATTNPQELGLNLLIREFIQEQGNRPGSLNYELLVDLPREELRVLGRPRLLKTVLDNLLTNAEQALSPSGTRRITISLARKAGEVQCSISDTGTGLPAGNWSLLVNPFVSSKGPFARNPAHAGIEATGLGLTVAQHLLKLQAGRLELKRATEGGVVASFYLPCIPSRTGQTTGSTKPHETIRADDEGVAFSPHFNTSTVDLAKEARSKSP